jgi:cell division inhibitor SepF
MIDRHYLGGREGRHPGEGGRRFSPTGLGLLYERFPPKRISVVHATSFDDALVLADRFKRQQLVILNLQRAGDQLSTQIVDFCAASPTRRTARYRSSPTDSSY